MPSVNKFVERMRYWCEKGNLGYDQGQRWNIREGGECDCSSLVIWCLHEAGFDTGNSPKYGVWPTTGATYTGNLSYVLTQRGWTRYPNSGKPQFGDILLSDKHHVAVCVGDGLIAQASNGEYGKVSGGLAGDQTGLETVVRAYYNYPWDCYLRYTKEEIVTDAEMRKIAKLAADEVWSRAIGSKSASTRLQQVSDEAMRTDDPTNRGYKLKDHDHIKWIAAAVQEMNGKLDELAAKVDALAVDEENGETR